MVDDKFQVSIRISKEDKEKFEMIQKELEATQSETLVALLEAFTKVPKLSEKELKELSTARDNSKLSVSEIIKRGLITEVRKINALAEKPNLENLTPEQLKQPANRFKGGASHFGGSTNC